MTIAKNRLVIFYSLEGFLFPRMFYLFILVTLRFDVDNPRQYAEFLCQIERYTDLQCSTPHPRMEAARAHTERTLADRVVYGERARR